MSSVISYLRQGKDNSQVMLIAANFTPVIREGYRLGVPLEGYWQEIVNTDSQDYGGSNVGNLGGQKSRAIPYHGQPCSVNLTLPPLALVILKYQG